MTDPLIQYLGQRAEAGALLSSVDSGRALEDLFGESRGALPRPYKIFFVDENLPPLLGFPVKDSPILRELDARLEAWIELEAAWQTTRDSSKKTVDQALSAYLAALIRVAENAMLSNLLADYHAIFWLVHSLQLSRHFTNLKKTVLSLDTHTGKSNLDQLRFRVFSRWSVEVREQMTQLTSRVGSVLDGEEERGLSFFRMLQENVLIVTEEFISPDLRELRSYVTGYLNQNYFAFREKFEKMRSVAGRLLESDRVFRAGAEMHAGRALNEIPTGQLIDSRFQQFLLGHPALDRELTAADRELIGSISRRLGEFAVLHLLRRGISWMTSDPSGEIVSTDRRQELRYARTTRPIDFGHSGVVDPMVYRFGLMYDITAFSETLGTIAKSGAKGEMGAYRQMLVFQRQLDAIATEQHLTLEKFLGDGAFYTTRRVVPLLRAAVGVQRCYDDLRQKGFAFDKGVRIALNYGYYRLLPMRFNAASNERVMEFYGPGLVELSRLTTGKAMKEIEEVQTFLVAHGYDILKVEQFFAPLMRATRIGDDAAQGRRYPAYIDANGHLANEGIVASLPLVQELSDELVAESHQLFRLLAPWGNYIAFKPDPGDVEFIGVSLIGTVSLKGLEKLEVAEVVPFRQGQVEIMPFEEGGVLLKLLRHEFHNRHLPELQTAPHPLYAGSQPPIADIAAVEIPKKGAAESGTILELLLCPKAGTAASNDGVLIGEWNPYSDEIRNPVRLPPGELERLLGLTGPITKEALEQHRHLLQQIYRRMRLADGPETIRLDVLRKQNQYVAFLLGEGARAEVQES